MFFGTTDSKRPNHPDDVTHQTMLNSIAHQKAVLLVVHLAAMAVVAGCSTRPISTEDVADTKHISLLKGQIGNFIKDLDGTRRGCIIHSASPKSQKIDPGALSATANSLRGYIAKNRRQKTETLLTLVGGNGSERDRLYSQILSTYKATGLDIRTRRAAPGELTPPYPSLCSGATGLYLTDSGVGYYSNFKSKDRGNTIVLQVHNRTPLPSTKHRYPTSESKRSHPRGRAGEYYDRYIK